MPPEAWRIGVAFAATLVGLVFTGWLSARLGQAPPLPAVARNVGVGILTMAITWGVGRLFDVATA